MSFNANAVLIVASILFVLGLIGVLTRKNIIFMLLSVEIMLTAAGLAFVIGTRPATLRGVAKGGLEESGVTTFVTG